MKVTLALTLLDICDNYQLVDYLEWSLISVKNICRVFLSTDLYCGELPVGQ